ncbi:expressed protein, partial [Phakopsora pachyrhizi]
MYISSLLAVLSFACCVLAQTNVTGPNNQTMPAVFAMNCTNTYLPVSERRLAQLASNTSLTPEETNKLSDNFTQAICQNTTLDLCFCDITSCGSGAIGKNCVKLNSTTGDPLEKNQTPLPTANCSASLVYNPKAQSEADKANMCMNAEGDFFACESYSGSTMCSMCVSSSDPTLTQ